MTSHHLERRKRWRELFAKATPGPWAMIFDADGRTPVVVNSHRSGVIRDAYADHNDMQFAAVAREGWPDALNDLEAAEQAVLDERIAREHAENEHNETLRRVKEYLATTKRQLDESTKATNELLLCAKEFREQGDQYLAELGPLRALRDAVMTWKRHRHTPNLLAAIAEHEKS
jgi:hypothetical protein